MCYSIQFSCQFLLVLSYKLISSLFVHLMLQINVLSHFTTAQPLMVCLFDFYITLLQLQMFSRMIKFGHRPLQIQHCA